jgi:hypothetical protein
MDIDEDEELEENFFLSEKEKEKLKQEMLDEDFKKAIDPKKETKKAAKKAAKIKEKKTFSKLGLGLIFIAVICLLIINLVPWFYIKFDSTLEHQTLEKVYYRDFNTDNGSLEVLNFFESSNSSKYLGLSSNDFTTLPQKAAYIFYSILILGILFTIIEIINKKREISLEKLIIIHTFFSAITAILCVYLIFLTVKFFGVHLLLYHNVEYIQSSLPNVILLFFAPIFLVFVTAGILKISSTTMKFNFNLFEKIQESKRPKKSLYNLKQGGKSK